MSIGRILRVNVSVRVRVRVRVRIRVGGSTGFIMGLWLESG